MKLILRSLVILAVLNYSSSTIEFTIGALLSNQEAVYSFERIVNSISDNVFDEVVKFKATGQVLALSALKATDQVCALFNATKGRLMTLIISHPTGAQGAPPLSVSFICAFYHVPIIGVSARQSVFSDKYTHGSFLRTVPPYSAEGIIWADLIRAFSWREVCLIHSDDQDSKKLLFYLERASDNEKNFKITHQVIINTDEEDAALVKDFAKILEPLLHEQTRVILLFLRRNFAEYVFLAARKLGMLGIGWAWIVSEQALDASNIPSGVIGARLSQAHELDHVADAVRVATQVIFHMVRIHPKAMRRLKSVQLCSENPSEVQTNNRSFGQTYLWRDYAIQLYREMLKVKLPDGRTGNVQFDQHGDRVAPIYEIVNAQAGFGQQNISIDFERPILIPVGSYGSPQPPPMETLNDEPYPPLLSINMSKLIWPGNNVVKRMHMVCTEKSIDGKCIHTEKRLIYSAPLSFKKKTHLKVVTIQSTPFVQHRLRTKDDDCNESDDPFQTKAEVKCKHTNPITGVKTYYCCYGYCIDLLRRLANRTSFDLSFTPFTFDLHLVGDGQVGDEIVENETRRWTGVVGEILAGTADLAVAPVSITPERATRVGFSKPFKYLGITILIKRERPRSNLGSFLQPFENSLWVLVALSVHVVALVLYLLDRFSPFGTKSFRKPTQESNHINESSLKLTNSDNWKKSHDQDEPISNCLDNEPEESMNLSSAVYFAWGVLLNSGIGEGTPRSFSARVLGMVWAGFAMIIVASYTANLAAFLVLDRPEASISGIDDFRLRNPQKDFTYATVRGSPVEMYFKRQVEYNTMYRMMEANNYDSVEDAIQAVKTGTLKAFIWDSARLYYEASLDCDLLTAGEMFGRMSYGLVMKKDNPWLYELSQAVLNFHERGIMETLDSTWIHIKSNHCERTETSPATLGLTNMAGVFIMVAMGIVVGFFLTLIEILCVRRSGAKKRKNHLTACTIQQWRQTVEKHQRERQIGGQINEPGQANQTDPSNEPDTLETSNLIHPESDIVFNPGLSSTTESQMNFDRKRGPSSTTNKEPKAILLTSQDDQPKSDHKIRSIRYPKSSTMSNYRQKNSVNTYACKPNNYNSPLPDSTQLTSGRHLDL